MQNCSALIGCEMLLTGRTDTLGALAVRGMGATGMCHQDMRKGEGVHPPLRMLWV